MARELILLPGIISPRRCGLFVLKAGERIWNAVEFKPLRRVIERARTIFDKPDAKLDLGELATPLQEAFMQAQIHDDWSMLSPIRVMGVLFTHPESAPRELITPSTFSSNTDVPPLLTPEELRKSCRLLREFIGFQGGPSRFEPSLFTTTVVSIAQRIDETQDFTLMRVLGDALEDTECEFRRDVVEHCRSKERHERGCWVVDGLLGRP